MDTNMLWAVPAILLIAAGLAVWMRIWNADITQEENATWRALGINPRPQFIEDKDWFAGDMAVERATYKFVE